ncbi:hypothetical protein B0J18DRAFT_426298 [Chaetomium sp. MPI-SDFR-AT-0129]|nr:hypothetical protein B0J18DRAFT_426298 [Chaetomium sp. MPI-SDFR-AT-0129]
MAFEAISPSIPPIVAAGPALFGYVHENGRVIGFPLENIKGSCPLIQDLRACGIALGKPHELGLFHGNPVQSSCYQSRGESARL